MLPPARILVLLVVAAAFLVEAATVEGERTIWYHREPEEGERTIWERKTPEEGEQNIWYRRELFIRGANHLVAKCEFESKKLNARQRAAVNSSSLFLDMD